MVKAIASFHLFRARHFTRAIGTIVASQWPIRSLAIQEIAPVTCQYFRSFDGYTATSEDSIILELTGEIHCKVNPDRVTFNWL